MRSLSIQGEMKMTFFSAEMGMITSENSFHSGPIITDTSSTSISLVAAETVSVSSECVSSITYSTHLHW